MQGVNWVKLLGFHIGQLSQKGRKRSRLSQRVAGALVSAPASFGHMASEAAPDFQALDLEAASYVQSLSLIHI